MGEIKSTLDIVLEKTKHLSMTDEEKLAKEKEKLSLSIKGIVQKYQDRVLSKEAFQKELKALHQRYAFEVRDILLNEILGRMDLESDNDILLKLIKEVLQIDSVKLEEVLNQFRNEIGHPKVYKRLPRDSVVKDWCKVGLKIIKSLDTKIVNSLYEAPEWELVYIFTSFYC